MATWVVAHPLLIALVTVLLLGLSLLRLFDFEQLRPRVEVDASMAALLPREGAALATFARAQRYFPDDDLLFVAWIADDLFSARPASAPGRAQAAHATPAEAAGCQRGGKSCHGL